MAFGLDKKQSKAKQELATRLETQAKIIREAVDDYNQVVEEARTFVTEIHEQWDSDISEKSEKWQGGDAGSAATELKDAWEGADMDDLELGDDELHHATTLNDLPDEAGG